MQIAKHKVVSIDYTLRNEQGDILDSSRGNAPLVYLHGENNIIPGLEDALEGKQMGDKLNVAVPPGAAYGEYLDSLQQVVPRAEFGSQQVQVGMQFQAYVHENSPPLLVTVVAVDGDNVTLDGNHPLAGQTLHFEVDVMEVRDANHEEISHGHVHGPDDHHH